MKTLIIVSFILLSFSFSSAAEFLIYAKIHWMECVDRRSWNDEQLVEYNRRLVKGNPIVVKPDGWKWGKRECPPDFIVIKVPGMKVKEGEMYLVGSTEYRKKYRFPPMDVDVAMNMTGIISTTKFGFANKIIDRGK